MMLVLLILLPLAGGFLAWTAERKSALLSRWISLAALLADALLIVRLWTGSRGTAEIAQGIWIEKLVLPWIPQFGISLELALDGLSLVMAALTVFLGIIAVLCSWKEVRERIGFFHFNLLWIVAGILGVFLSLDLLLFYVFWELMLIPMYFLISIWGHEDRIRAAWKFFLFTQAGGLLMLLSIFVLYFAHGRGTGIFTFDYELLLSTPLPPMVSFWTMLGFFIAFGVKLPVVPFHTWLPDAHTEAPTAGSVILAGLLLKTGAYGMLRFVLPLFPESARLLAPAAMSIAVLGIVYGALVAFGQTDLKRLVAYTSVSHMGFVLLGIFAGGLTSRSGAVLQMVVHGISTGALFLLVGMVQERVHTRDLGRMGGFWASAPRLSALGLVFCLASLGLPGSGNFAAEFLVLLGTFQVSVPFAAAAASGLVLAAVYSLWIAQKVFHGEPAPPEGLVDLSSRETFILTMLVIAIFWIGLHPAPVTDLAGPVLGNIPCCGQLSGMYR